MLSGGLDSSIVTTTTAHTREASPEQPHPTFSLIFDTVTQSDEREYIQAVLENGVYTPHFVHGDEEPLFGSMRDMLDAVEQPFNVPNLYLHWALFRAARRADVPVLLDGFLGDNVIGHGDRYLTDLAMKLRWFELYRQVKGVVKLHGGGMQQVRNLLRIYAAAPLRSMLKQKLGRKSAHEALLAELASSPLRDEFVRDSGWMTHALEVSQPKTSPPCSEQEVHLRDVESGAVLEAVEVAGKTAMYFGVDLRFPFANKDLMEFCLTVPARQRCNDGQTRLNARRAFAPFLPRRIVRRTDKADLLHVTKHVLQRSEISPRSLHKDISKQTYKYISPEGLKQICCSHGDGYLRHHSLLFRIKTLDYFLKTDFSDPKD